MQNETMQKLKRIEGLKRSIDQQTEHHMAYIRNVTHEMNAMRETIRNLMSQNDGNETIKGSTGDDRVTVKGSIRL